MKHFKNLAYRITSVQFQVAEIFGKQNEVSWGRHKKDENIWDIWELKKNNGISIFRNKSMIISYNEVQEHLVWPFPKQIYINIRVSRDQLMIGLKSGSYM